VVEAMPGAVLERERKYRLDETLARELRLQLAEIGEHVRQEFQVTEVLDHPALGLREKGEVLRLRWTNGDLELTYKPALVRQGKDKVRRELTVPITSQVQTLLGALGFAPVVRYVKETEVFAIGDVLVFVDHVEDLGWFCEIEARDEGSDLEMIAGLLHLETERLEESTYPEMVARAR